MAGPLPRAIALRISSVAVRQMPSSIGSVEFSMKKSLECSTKPRLGFDRAALEHLHAAGARRQLDQVGRRDHVELHQQVGEADVRRRLVDDDAHGAVGRVGADIDHAARETIVAHGRHRDQHLAVEIAALGAGTARPAFAACRTAHAAVGGRLARFRSGFRSVSSSLPVLRPNFMAKCYSIACRLPTTRHARKLDSVRRNRRRCSASRHDMYVFHVSSSRPSACRCARPSR